VKILFFRNFIKGCDHFDNISSELIKRGCETTVLLSSRDAIDWSAIDLSCYSKNYAYEVIDDSYGINMDSITSELLIDVILPTMDRVQNIGLDYPIERVFEESLDIYRFLFKHMSEFSYDAVLYEQESCAFSLILRRLTKIFNYKYITYSKESFKNGFSEIYYESWPELSNAIKGNMHNYKDNTKSGLDLYRTLTGESSPKSKRYSYLDSSRSHKIGMLKSVIILPVKLVTLFITLTKASSLKKEPLHGPIELWAIRSYLTKLYRSIKWPIYSLMFRINTKLPKCKYIIYPLQFRPEASTSVIGKKYMDEIGLIDKIIQKLPEDVFLYVKDHPYVGGYRSLTFYINLFRNSKVKTLRHHSNIANFIKKSEGVIVNTSKFGLEAALINKNIFCIGSPIYKTLPGVQSIDEIDTLDLKKNTNSENLKNRQLEWLSAYDNICVRSSNFKEISDRIIFLCN
jgi:hypothetical protein